MAVYILWLKNSRTSEIQIQTCEIETKIIQISKLHFSSIKLNITTYFIENRDFDSLFGYNIILDISNLPDQLVHFKGVVMSDLIKALEALKMLQIDTGR